MPGSSGSSSGAAGGSPRTPAPQSPPAATLRAPSPTASASSVSRISTIVASSEKRAASVEVDHFDKGDSSTMTSGLLGGEYQLKLIMLLALQELYKNNPQPYSINKESRWRGAIDDLTLTFNDTRYLAIQAKHGSPYSNEKEFKKAFFLGKEKELADYFDSYLIMTSRKELEGKNIWLLFYTNKKVADNLKKVLTKKTQALQGFEETAEVLGLKRNGAQLENTYVFKNVNEVTKFLWKRSSISLTLIDIDFTAYEAKIKRWINDLAGFLAKEVNERLKPAPVLEDINFDLIASPLKQFFVGLFLKQAGSWQINPAFIENKMLNEIHQEIRDLFISKLQGNSEDEIKDALKTISIKSKGTKFASLDFLDIDVDTLNFKLNHDRKAELGGVLNDPNHTVETLSEDERVALLSGLLGKRKADLRDLLVHEDKVNINKIIGIQTNGHKKTINAFQYIINELTSKYANLQQLWGSNAVLDPNVPLDVKRHAKKQAIQGIYREFFKRFYLCFESYSQSKVESLIREKLKQRHGLESEAVFLTFFDKMRKWFYNAWEASKLENEIAGLVNNAIYSKETAYLIGHALVSAGKSYSHAWLERTHVAEKKNLDNFIKDDNPNDILLFQDYYGSLASFAIASFFKDLNRLDTWVFFENKFPDFENTKSILENSEKIKFMVLCEINLSEDQLEEILVLAKKKGIKVIYLQTKLDLVNSVIDKCKLNKEQHNVTLMEENLLEQILSNILKEKDRYFEYASVIVSLSSVFKNKSALFQLMRKPGYLIEVLENSTLIASIVNEDEIFIPCDLKYSERRYNLSDLVQNKPHVYVALEFFYKDFELIKQKIEDKYDVCEVINYKRLKDLIASKEEELIFILDIESLQSEAIIVRPHRNYIASSLDITCQGNFDKKIPFSSVDTEYNSNPDVKHNKIPSIIKRIFSTTDSILVTGQAGFGKSHHTKMWMTFMNADPRQTAIAIYIKLRFLTEEDLKLDFFSLVLKVLNITESSPLIIELLKHKIADHKVVIFFDGLDEVHPSRRERIFVFIKKITTKFPSVLTTRNYLTKIASSDVHYLLEINQFTHSQINEYFKLYLSDYSDDTDVINKYVQALLEHIQNMHGLKDIFTVPIITNQLAETCKDLFLEWIDEEEGDIEDYIPWKNDISKVELYESIIQQKLLRYFSKSHSARNIDPDLKGNNFLDALLKNPDIAQSMEIVLLQCSAIAIRNQFNEKGLLDAILMPGVSDIINQTGLLEAFEMNESFRGGQREIRGDFVHKSFQEFLSAYFILYGLLKARSGSPHHRQALRFMRTYYHTVQQREVFEFLFEMLELNNEIFMGISLPDKLSWKDFLAHSDLLDTTKYEISSLELTEYEPQSLFVVTDDNDPDNPNDEDLPAIIQNAVTSTAMFNESGLSNKKPSTQLVDKYIRLLKAMPHMQLNNNKKHLSVRFALRVIKDTMQYFEEYNSYGGLLRYKATLIFHAVYSLYQVYASGFQFINTDKLLLKEAIVDRDYEGNGKVRDNIKLCGLSSLLSLELFIKGTPRQTLEHFLLIEKTECGSQFGDLKALFMLPFAKVLVFQYVNLIRADNQICEKIFNVCINNIDVPEALKILIEGNKKGLSSFLTSEITSKIAALKTLDKKQKALLAENLIILLKTLDEYENIFSNYPTPPDLKGENKDLQICKLMIEGNLNHNCYVTMKDSSLTNLFYIARILGKELTLPVLMLITKKLLDGPLCHFSHGLECINHMLDSASTFSPEVKTGFMIFLSVFLSRDIKTALLDSELNGFILKLWNYTWEYVLSEPEHYHYHISSNVIAFIAKHLEAQVYFVDRKVYLQYQDLAIEPLVSPELPMPILRFVLKRFAYLRNLGLENLTLDDFVCSQEGELSWADDLIYPEDLIRPDSSSLKHPGFDASTQYNFPVQDGDVLSVRGDGVASHFSSDRFNRSLSVAPRFLGSRISISTDSNEQLTGAEPTKDLRFKTKEAKQSFDENFASLNNS